MNRRKPKALKIFEGTYRKDRDKNPDEGKTLVSFKTINCPDTIQGKAREIWEQLVPGLCALGLLGLQDIILLEQTFMLLQEVYYIQTELQRLRGLKTNRGNRDKKVNMLNNQLVKTSRQCSLNLSKLGFSPSDRSYIPPPSPGTAGGAKKKKQKSLTVVDAVISGADEDGD